MVYGVSESASLIRYGGIREAAPDDAVIGDEDDRKREQAVFGRLVRGWGTLGRQNPAEARGSESHGKGLTRSKGPPPQIWKLMWLEQRHTVEQQVVLRPHLALTRSSMPHRRQVEAPP